ncbi:hypothetical protein C0992_005374 [Termitomyces sp. T32_za158]|nr:hypothetical protein C0992_005374 [Termitomyces sp. T32_za158]
MLQSQGKPHIEDLKLATDSSIPARPASLSFVHGQDSAVPFHNQLAAANPTCSLPPTHIASSSGSNRDIQHTAASSVSSSQMIGPTSTFYDPNAMAQGQGDNQSQYQQWIDDAYGRHEQHPLHQQTMLQHSAHRRPDTYQPQSQVYHHDSRHSMHPSEPYGHPQHTYPQASQTTSNQSGLGSLMAPSGDSAPYLPAIARDQYVRYISHPNPVTGTNPSGLNVTHQTSKPLYPQQQIPHGVQSVPSHPHSQSQSQIPPQPFISIDTTIPLSSEVLTPGSHPQSSHSSSLSPAAKTWIEEIYSKPAISTLNIAQTTTAMPAAPNFGPSSSKPAQSKPRMPNRRTTASPPENTSKSLAKRKRPNPGIEESSEEDEVENPFNSGGISVGMAGMGVVGGGTRSRL